MFMNNVKAKKDTKTPGEQLSMHQMVNGVLKNPEIARFVKANKLTKEDVENNLSLFLAFQLRSEICQNCSGLDKCGQSLRGKEPFLDNDEGYLVLDIRDCKYQQIENERIQKSERLEFIGPIPNGSNTDDVIVNQKRRAILSQINKFIENYPKPQKGIYLYGPYGCGKSFLMWHFARQLTELGANVLFVYYPEFVRLIKSTIGRDSGMFDDLTNQLKEAEILILDDLGGEMSSAFIRDEVLSPILQERMLQRKPMFVTSNLSRDQLTEHLRDTGKDSDIVKAERIVERMKTLMDFIPLDDKNYRL
jgi:primosomal protein DnaI